MTMKKKNQPALLDIVQQTLSDHDMIKKKDAVLAAVSGGPDSMTLAHVLLQLKNEYDLTLGTAHLNHGLRFEDANRDELFVKKIAYELDLPFFSKTEDIQSIAVQESLSIETAGRNARYAFFKKTAKEHGYSKIATGHTYDDNAELVLMNLLRGAGAKGLSGIPPKRNDLFIRPLIRVTKSTILEFLSHKDQSYMIDSSNEDTVFLRNKIRHHLLPMLEKEYNPEVQDCLNRTSQILKLENEFMEDLTLDTFQQLLKKEHVGFIELFLDRFNDLHPAIKHRVVRKAILNTKGDLLRIALGHVQDIVQLALSSPKGKSLDLPGQIRVFKTRDTICFKKESMPLRDLDRSQI